MVGLLWFANAVISDCPTFTPKNTSSEKRLEVAARGEVIKIRSLGGHMIYVKKWGAPINHL